MCSHRRTPGTLVAMERKAPRISAGASGLGSQVSIWLCPPEAKTIRTDFALPVPRRGARRGGREPEAAEQAEAQPLAAGGRRLCEQAEQGGPPRENQRARK